MGGAGGVEIIDEDEYTKEREDEEIHYENTPIEQNLNNEIKDYIKKPCIRNIKNISFDKKIYVNDTAGQLSFEKLSLIDKGTAVTPHFLPVCRIYSSSKSWNN